MYKLSGNKKGLDAQISVKTMSILNDDFEIILE